MGFAVPEGHDLPDSSLPSVDPSLPPGQIRREPRAWWLIARQRSSPASPRTQEVGFSSGLFFRGLRGLQGCSHSAVRHKQGASANAPGALSPWLLGSLQPLWQDSLATSSSLVQ